MDFLFTSYFNREQTFQAIETQCDISVGDSLVLLMTYRKVNVRLGTRESVCGCVEYLWTAYFHIV